MTPFNWDFLPGYMLLVAIVAAIIAISVVVGLAAGWVIDRLSDGEGSA